MQDACRKRNILVWCGGMLESGTGRAHESRCPRSQGFPCPVMFPPVNVIGPRTLLSRK